MRPLILIFLCFAALGLGLAFFFALRTKGDRFGNRLLALYTFLFSFELVYHCLNWSGALEQSGFVHFNLSQIPLWSVYGPIVYLYVRRMLRKKGLLPADLLFLIPTGLLIGFLWKFYRLDTATKTEVINSGTLGEYIHLPTYWIWILLGLMLSYALLTWWRFAKGKAIGFRENEWLKWFLGAYLGYVLAFGAYFILVRSGIMPYTYDYFIDTLIVVFIAILSFFGFAQPHVFEGKAWQEVVPFIKYRKNGISRPVAQDKAERLKRLMDSEKLYREPNLRLDDVASALHLSRNNTSQVINQQFNLSFFDYINKYRITEAKDRLLESTGGSATVSDIAYQVGFNNRASFYKAFKKFTNQSPSEFINGHQRAS